MKIEKMEVKTYKDVYVAIDGTKFSDKDECIKYENTARCVIKEMAKRLVLKETSSEAYLNAAGDNFSCDGVIRVYDLKTKDDVDAFNKFLKITGYGDGGLLSYDYAGKKVALENYYDDESWLVGTKEELLERVTAAIEAIFEEDMKDEAVSD